MRIYQEPGLSSSYVLETEVEFHKAIASHHIILFQAMFAYEISGNDLISSPFVSLQWIEGASLQWTESYPARRSDREKVIKAIAQATVDLLVIQKPGYDAISVDFNARTELIVYSKISQTRHRRKA